MAGTAAEKQPRKGEAGQVPESAAGLLRDSQPDRPGLARRSLNCPDIAQDGFGRPRPATEESKFHDEAVSLLRRDLVRPARASQFG